MKKGWLLLLSFIFFPFLLFIPLILIASAFWPAFVFTELPGFYTFFLLTTWVMFVGTGATLFINRKK